MNNRPNPYLPLNRRGFTLVELLVALGLGGVVLAILVGFFSNVTRTSTVQNAVASAQQTARIGIDFIVQEIRMTGLDPLKTSGAGIEEITAAGEQPAFHDRPLQSAHRRRYKLRQPRSGRGCG